MGATVRMVHSREFSNPLYSRPALKDCKAGLSAGLEPRDYRALQGARVVAETDGALGPVEATESVWAGIG